MKQIRQLSLYLSPSSALCKQLHSRAMRLFTSLEYEHRSCASCLIYSMHAPKQAGFATWIGLSHATRSHRGYIGLRPIWEMVVRTAYTQLRYSPFLLLLATLIMGVMFWVSPFAFLLVPGSNGITIAVLSWLAMLVICPP